MPCETYPPGHFGPVSTHLAVYSLATHLDGCSEFVDRLETRILPWEPIGTGTDKTDFGFEESLIDLIQQVMTFRPMAVAFSLYAWTIVPCQAMARALHRVNPELVLIAGGPEVFEREALVQEFQAFDVVVEGRGEEPMKALMERLLSGSRDMTGIPGVSFRREDGSFVHNPSGLSDCDTPELAKVFKDFADGLGRRAFYLGTGGCPHRCLYCLWPKDKSRSSPARDLVESIRVMLDAPQVKQIVFFDHDLVDLHGQDREGYDSVSRLLQARPDVTSAIFTSPGNLVAPAINEVIRDLRVDSIFVGVQSLNPKALQASGRGWSVEQVKSLELIGPEARVRTVVELMVPLPEETPESFYEGLERLLELGFRRFQIFPLMVLRGTALRKRAEKLGIAYQMVPPYLCFRTPTFPTQDWIIATCCGAVLKHLSVRGDPSPAGVEALDRFYGKGTNRIREIRERLTSGETIAAISQSLGAEIDALSNGNQQGPRQIPLTGGVPTFEMLELAGIQRQVNAVIESYGARLIGDRMEGDRIVCSVSCNGKQFQFTVSTALDDDAPVFGKAGRFRVAYQGKEADLGFLEAIVDFLERQERARSMQSRDGSI